MKIAILGSGSMGLMFGTALSYGHEVIFLDTKPETVEAINERGSGYFDDNVLIRSGDVRAYHSGSFNETVDLLVVLVKTTDTVKAMDMNRKIMDSDTYVLTLQNGLGNKDILLQYVNEDHLLLGVTRANANRFDERLSLRANHGKTYIGYNPSTRPIAESVQLILSRNDFYVGLTEDIESEIYRKLFLNVSLNPLCALYDRKIDDILSDPCYHEEITELLSEAVDVANSQGQSFNKKEEIDFVFSTAAGIFGYPSMWQDVRNHRKTEIESQNGAIVAIGHQNSIDVSHNEDVVRRIQEKENTYLRR